MTRFRIILLFKILDYYILQNKANDVALFSKDNLSYFALQHTKSYYLRLSFSKSHLFRLCCHQMSKLCRLNTTLHAYMYTNKSFTIDVSYKIRLYYGTIRKGKEANSF